MLLIDLDCWFRCCCFAAVVAKIRVNTSVPLLMLMLMHLLLLLIDPLLLLLMLLIWNCVDLMFRIIPLCYCCCCCQQSKNKEEFCPS